jgi:hypothetical protein
MSASLPFSEVTRLDYELVRIGRGAAVIRLSIGAMLDVLSSSGGHHELGFSSLEAYARERCERTGRWAVDTRALARKLASLPEIRRALGAGAIGWSTAELLARHVTAESELEWLERARTATVRELRALLAQASGGVVSDDHADEEADQTRGLTVSATKEDGWTFECARKVAEAVVGPLSSERLLGALLAEGYSTLLELVPESERSPLYDLETLEDDAAAESDRRAAWCAARRRWRSEAEELCERHLSLPPQREAGDAVSFAWSPSETPEVLDREIRRRCSELSERDLALGIVAESARKAEVWRRLGFATEAQYARERVGVSLSSLKAKRILAARAGRVPELATALSSGRIGYEAAYLLSRVVTPPTVREWLRHAERRTVKHLREEVEAAELLIRMGLGRDQAPLDEPSLDMMFELERCIASGDLGRAGDNKAFDCSKCEPAEANDERREGWHAGQMSGVPRAAGRRATRRMARCDQRFGRVTLRWVVTEETQRFFRALERVFSRVSSRICSGRTSFLRFLCENFSRIWLPALRREHLTESGELTRVLRRLSA